MKKLSLLVLSIATFLITGSMTGSKAASAETVNLRVPFTAVVGEYCQTPTTLLDIHSDNQSACTAQQEIVTAVERVGVAKESVEAVNQPIDTTSRQEGSLGTTVLQVTIVGR